MRIELRARTPDAIDGALARGDVVARLLSRLLACTDDELGKLRGVIGRELAIVIGPSDALPWVDALCWLARAPDEPALWLPTDLALRLPASVVLRALSRRVPRPRTPLVLLPDTRELVSLAEARPLARVRLQAELEARR
jgi:hypothetical protein